MGHDDLSTKIDAIELSSYKLRQYTVVALAGCAVIIAITALLIGKFDTGTETVERQVRECLAIIGDLEKGLQGDKGDTGDAGAQGDKGDTGDAGAQGEPGPQGDKGDTGDTGAQGGVGPQGMPGVQGEIGDCGLSAYETWLALGNVGTEQDFLNSLVGPKGADGPAGPQGAPGGFGVRGSFYDTSTIPLEQNVASAIPLNTTVFANGVQIVDLTKITFEAAGKFNILLSAQLEKADAGTDVVSVWLSKNGQNVPWTNTDVILTASNLNSRFVIALNFFVDATSGDYFELKMTSTTSARTVLKSVSTQTNPDRPETPSTILSVHQVG